MDTIDDIIKRIKQRNLEMEGYIWICQTCGKTPQNIGWCDQCGYNRNYKKVRNTTVQ